MEEELLLNTELTEESKDRSRHLLKEFCLYEYRDTHPSTLSGGQKQRLAIACAIFSGRRILILDEPTSGLDGQNMRLIAERLKSEARNGRTILSAWISHSGPWRFHDDRFSTSTMLSQQLSISSL